MGLQALDGKQVWFTSRRSALAPTTHRPDQSFIIYSAFCVMENHIVGDP